MIMTIVESGGKLPKGASTAVFAMLAYVAAASIAAGFGDLGSGLLVLVMGGVTIAIVDYVMWRDVSSQTAVKGGLGPYVLAGTETPLDPETPSTEHPFVSVRREENTGPAHAPVSAPEPTPAAPSAPVPEPVAIAAMPEPVAASTPVAPAPADVTPEAKANAVGSRPVGLDRPRTGGADDLKRINGIGPTNEKKLNALGVWHFDQIAAWDDAQVRWVGTYLAFPGRIEREDWVGQAKAIMASAETA